MFPFEIWEKLFESLNIAHLFRLKRTCTEFFVWINDFLQRKHHIQIPDKVLKFNIKIVGKSVDLCFDGRISFKQLRFCIMNHILGVTKFPKPTDRMKSYMWYAPFLSINENWIVQDFVLCLINLQFLECSYTTFNRQSDCEAIKEWNLKMDSELRFIENCIFYRLGINKNES